VVVDGRKNKNLGKESRQEGISLYFGFETTDSDEEGGSLSQTCVEFQKKNR